MPLISRTLTTALAALLIAAPAATAVPANTQDLRSPDARDAANRRQSPTSSRAGTTAPAADTQDLRSPDARDAANRSQSPTSSLAGTTAPAQDPSPTWTKPLSGPPTWPMDLRPITPAATAKAIDGGNGVDWTSIGLGVVGSLLAISGLAALTSRRSRRRQRLRATV